MIGSAFLLATGSLERSLEYEHFTNRRLLVQKAHGAILKK